ncbi:MAG: hypothetical protein IPH46_09605 [Bacteroidetes bacterium]|nr:hypothetical protein [Bacteroidota bacterium]
MNVIWLCSWYPNAVDAYRGDFIQRQAIATSAFARIDVVHIVFCDYHKATVTQVNAQLTEHIFYVKQQHKGKDLIQFLQSINGFCNNTKAYMDYLIGYMYRFLYGQD